MIEMNDTIYSLGHKLDKEREARERAEREVANRAHFEEQYRQRIRELKAKLEKTVDWLSNNKSIGTDGLGLMTELQDTLAARGQAVDVESEESNERPTPPRSYTINKRGVREPVNRKENE